MSTYTMNNYAVEFYTIAANDGYSAGDVVAQVVTKTVGVVIAEATGATKDEALTALSELVWMGNCGCGRQIIEQRTDRDFDPTCCECQAKTKKAVVQARVRRTEKAKVYTTTSSGRTGRGRLAGAVVESKAISFEQAQAILEAVS